jgi:hypothetical protein
VMQRMYACAGTPCSAFCIFLDSLVLLLVQGDSRVVLEVTGSTRPNGQVGWRNWLKHCATSRKVSGSILDGALEFSVTQWGQLIV